MKTREWKADRHRRRVQRKSAVRKARRGTGRSRANRHPVAFLGQPVVSNAALRKSPPIQRDSVLKRSIRSIQKLFRSPQKRG